MDRHASAQELADDLGRWLAGEETSARRWGWVQRVRGWRRRNSTTAPLIVGFLVLSLAVGVLLGHHVVEMVREPERIQLALAKQRAALLDVRVRELVTAVQSVARQPELAVALAAGQREPIVRFINAVGAERVDLNGQSPFASWFVLDTEGTILARWPSLPGVIREREFQRREYLVRALRDPAGAPQVTGVFHSIVDGQYKFGISVVIRSGDRTVGVLAASVPTSSTLGLSLPSQDDSQMVLLAGVDQSSRDDDKLTRCERVILLHPAYERGSEPLCIRDSDVASAIGIRRGYRDPVATIDPRFAGYWLGALEPVGDTGFTVLVQRRYPGAGGLPTVAIVLGTVTPLALLALVLLSRRWLRGRSPQVRTGGNVDREP